MSSSDEELAEITKLAYDYAFSVMMFDTTKRVMVATKAPINQLFHAPSFPTADDTDVVQPNADTLYSQGFLDGLSNDPIVLHVPPVDRYFLLPILDLYTNVVSSPGTRTSDQFPPGNYAICGPDFPKAATLPDKVSRIDVPTNTAWIIGRTATKGPDDYAAVHAIQATYTLTPLSKWDTGYQPPPFTPESPSGKTPVEIVQALTTKEYFVQFSEAWKSSPPLLPDDGPALELFKRINLIHGQIWDPSSLSDHEFEVVDNSYYAARDNLKANGEKIVPIVNGWSNPLPNTGRFGADYTYRAYIALVALGANWVEDSIYNMGSRDAVNITLNAKYRYKFHLDNPPPVNAKAFWSLTMYNDKYYFVKNSANIQCVSSLYPQGNRVVPTSGPIDIYIQTDPPESDTALWLPAPAVNADGSDTPFNLMLRRYWVTDTSWVAPGVESQLSLVTQLAYDYAFALLMFDSTKTLKTATRAPVNQFAHDKAFPTPADTSIVQPNADTLYSQAFLDNLSSDPIILQVPSLARYFLLPMLDAYTNVVASPGTRTIGQFPPGNYAICGPDFSKSATLPANVGRINVPTNWIWILGRTATYGPSDYDAVYAIQAKYTLTPLSKWNTGYQPPTFMPLPTPIESPLQIVQGLTSEEFFVHFSEVWKTNPPLRPADDPALLLFESVLHLKWGETWNKSSLSAQDFAIVDKAYSAARDSLGARGVKPLLATSKNGWSVPLDCTGNFGTNYTYRAYIALVGIGANIEADAIYNVASVDSTGQPFNAKHSYKLHLERDQVPPVNAFWSLTMYNEQYYFVQNSAGIQVVSTLYPNGDRVVPTSGPIDIYMQTAPPEGSTTLWLPAPPVNADGSDTPFYVDLRRYWVTDTTWVAPAVQKSLDSNVVTETPQQHQEVQQYQKK